MEEVEELVAIAEERKVRGVGMGDVKQMVIRDEGVYKGGAGEGEMGEGVKVVDEGIFWREVREEGGGKGRQVEFPNSKMAKGIGGRLNKSFEESRNGEVRADNIQLHLEGDGHRAFKVNYEKCVKRVKGSLRLLFTLVRRGEIRGERDPGLDRLREKIKKEHEMVVGQIKKFKEDGGDRMGKIKGKILLPLRAQLEHCYEITGERKGGWN